MKLNTAEVASTFQKRPAYRYIRATDKLPTETPDVPFSKITARVKLFNPTGSGTWYLTSYDPADGVAYGVADLGYGPEFGAIYIPELLAFRGRMGLPIERDLYFDPKTIDQLMKEG